MKDLILKYLKFIPVKVILLSIWEDVRPKIEAKVIDTESKIDDAVLAALDLLVEKFLK